MLLFVCTFIKNCTFFQQVVKNNPPLKAFFYVKTGLNIIQEGSKGRQRRGQEKR